jgi:carotene epsilon-monooxygenase
VPVAAAAAAKHVLRSTDNSTRNIYNKGLVAEVSEANQFATGVQFGTARIGST